MPSPYSFSAVPIPSADDISPFLPPGALPPSPRRSPRNNNWDGMLHPSAVGGRPPPRERRQSETGAARQHERRPSEPARWEDGYEHGHAGYGSPQPGPWAYPPAAYPPYPQPPYGYHPPMGPPMGPSPGRGPYAFPGMGYSPAPAPYGIWPDPHLGYPSPVSQDGYQYPAAEPRPNYRPGRPRRDSGLGADDPARTDPFLPDPHGEFHAPPLGYLSSLLLEPSRIKVNPLLSFPEKDKDLPNIDWNVLFAPTTARLQDDKSGRALRNEKRQQPATQPLLTHLVIVITGFHWPIRISKSEVITVGHVMDSIHHCLMHAIHPAEWHQLTRAKDSATHEFYKRIAHAAHFNRSSDPHAPGSRMPDGMARGDLLVNKTQWAGLREDEQVGRNWKGMHPHCTLVLELDVSDPRGPAISTPLQEGSG